MFYYKVEYLEHGGDVPETTKKDHGITSADSYAMAADMVTEYYPNVIHMELEEWEDVITADDIAEDFNV